MVFIVLSLILCRLLGCFHRSSSTSLAGGKSSTEITENNTKQPPRRASATPGSSVRPLQQNEASRPVSGGGHPRAATSLPTSSSPFTGLGGGKEGAKIGYDSQKSKAPGGSALSLSALDAAAPTLREAQPTKRPYAAPVMPHMMWVHPRLQP